MGQNSELILAPAEGKPPRFILSAMMHLGIHLQINTPMM
jgi:hypothetical protein